MTKLILCLFIGAGILLIALEYVEQQERKRAALMKKWRDKDRDV